MWGSRLNRVVSDTKALTMRVPPLGTVSVGSSGVSVQLERAMAMAATTLSLFDAARAGKGRVKANKGHSSQVYADIS
jgi:hypothetical protein